MVALEPEDAALKAKQGDVPRQPLVKRPRQADKMFTLLQKLRDAQAASSRYAKMQVFLTTCSYYD